MPLVIGFRMQRTNTLLSTLVACVAGLPTHVVIGNPETGEWWHSDSPKGVFPVPYDPVTQPKFEFWQAPDCVDPEWALHWCRRQAVARYDWLSVVGYWLPLTSRYRWTCSEFVADALAAGGEHAWVRGAAGTPRRLRKALPKHGYTLLQPIELRLNTNATNLLEGA